MSLVNDMLRDLDRRKQRPIGDGGRINSLIGFALAEAAPRSRALLMPALVTAAVLAGVGSGYFLFDVFDDEVAPVTAELPLIEDRLIPAPVQQLQAPPEAPRLQIADVLRNDTEFSLRLRGNTELGYAITDRSSTGITIRFDGIEGYDNGGTRVEGLSVIQMPDHTLLELSLGREADIELFEDSSSPEFDLVLAATYRKPAVETVVAQETYQAPLVSALPEQASTTESPTQSLVESLLDDTMLASPPEAAEGTAAVPTLQESDRSVQPQRVTRGLTFEQQDRNTSQNAITLVQGGRLLEAYEKLLTFIARNPEAHISRETLGTVLLAQREYEQAAIIAEEGLRLAPNHAPYKKIRARLLMQEGRAADALALLQTMPPTLQLDQEYHELLATLYQQNGDHARAITTYQNLLRMNQNEGRWWTGMGISLEAQGDTQKALASYQAALQQKNLDGSVRQYSQNRVKSLGLQ